MSSHVRTTVMVRRFSDSRRFLPHHLGAFDEAELSRWHHLHFHKSASNGPTQAAVGDDVEDDEENVIGDEDGDEADEADDEGRRRGRRSLRRRGKRDKEERSYIGL